MKKLGLWLSTALAVYVSAPSRVFGVAVALGRCPSELLVAEAHSPVHIDYDGDRRHVEFRAFQKESEDRHVSMAVDVVDPGHLLASESHLFDIAASQTAPLERIRFLIARVNARREQIVISVQGTETHHRYEKREDLTTPPIVLEYQGSWLPEHPDLALVGATTRIFYKELMRFFEERKSLAVLKMTERIDEIAQKIRNLHIPFDEATLRKAILNTLLLRSVWYAKEMLVNEIGPERARDLRTGWDKDHPQTDIEYLNIRHRSSGSGEEEFRESFTRFYGLDPRFVEAIWNEPLPDGWDFPLANPPRIPLVP